MVDSRIDDGRRLVEELPALGFDLAGAVWLLNTVDYKWRFYIVSPLVDSNDPREAYGRLFDSTRRMPQTNGINPISIELVGTDEPLGKAIVTAIRGLTANRNWANPMRWRDKWIGNVSIDDAYIYAPLVAAAT